MMKVSNKIITKIGFLLIIIGLLVGISSLDYYRAYNKYYYQYYSNPNVLDELISPEIGPFRIYKHNLQYPGTTHVDLQNHEDAIKYHKLLVEAGYDLNNNGEIEEEEFYQGRYNEYISNSNDYYQTYNIANIAIIILYIVLISMLIITLIYFIKINKLTKTIKKYRDYMLSANKFTINEISMEFGESTETVEANIQKAINKKILKNVYLSRQTKEILLIKDFKTNSKVKGNIQNVNVENNVIINEKGEN